MQNIWLTGDAVVDLIADSETTYLKCPGGAPANVAVALARLGAKVGFFGRVGLDPLGKFMHKTLSLENIDTSNLILDKEHRTSTVIVELENGERSFTFMVKPSADQFVVASDIPEFQKNQWLHFCSIALANNPARATMFSAMQKMKAAGGFISFDPNLRAEVWLDQSEIIEVVMQALKFADVVKFSIEELLYLTAMNTIDAALAVLEPLKLPLIVITQGSKGAIFKFGKIKQQVLTKKIKPVDTTGAGDAFVGGLLAKLCQEQDNWQNLAVITEAMQWANACGALAITKKGAMTALPTKRQLLKLLAENTAN